MPEEWKQKEEPVEPAEPEESAEAPEEENKSYKDIPNGQKRSFKAVEMGIAKGYDDGVLVLMILLAVLNLHVSSKSIKG